MKRFLLFLLGIALFPVIPAIALSISDLLPAVSLHGFPWIAHEPLAVFSGYAFWTLVFLIMPPSAKVYVLGHELTHALWGLLTFSRVGRLRVDKNGGSVDISHPGFFTTLAPYFIPFYLVVVLLLRFCLGLFIPMEPYALCWLFLIGIAYGFHVTYTVKSLSCLQPDICVYGHVISYVAIVIFNLLLFGYGFVAVTPATLPTYHQQLVVRTFQSYDWTYSRMLAGGRSIASHLAGR